METETLVSITPPSEDVSALHGGTEGSVENRDMFYFPDMGDLPEFDLPEDLELPNIASDLQVCVRCCVSSCCVSSCCVSAAVCPAVH